EGGGTPLAEVEMAEPLDLVAARMECAGGNAGRTEGSWRTGEGVGWIDEGLLVPVAPVAHLALPPGDRPRAEVDGGGVGLALLVCVGIDRGNDGRRVAHELDRHAGVGLVVADGAAQPRVAPGDVQAEATGHRVLDHAVVDGEAVGLQV